MRTLEDPSLLETRSFINGAWRAGKLTLTVTNPATGETVADVADLGVEGTRAAIEAAHAAKPGWAALTGKERSAILFRLYELIMENADDLATILTAEMGKPWSEARGEVVYGASYIQWFAEEAKRVYGDVIPAPQSDKRLVVIKQPVGVVGSITPWNFPNAMIARKMGPALAVGCTFVARPSELTPLSALALAVLAERAGVPAGVFNVVPSMDAAGAGLELCTNPKVAKITFTGSTNVGRILLRQCADDVKKVSLELGGNAPFIVFDDADLDAAVEGAMMAKFRNAGQTCVCANRIYVQAGIHDAFAEKLAEKVGALKLGDGFEAEVTTGPLISESAIAKVENHISDAVVQGAEVMAGGSRVRRDGLFIEPTLMKGVTQNMLVAREETFGPLMPLIKFATEEEVIAYANDSEFGLACYFYTKDVSRAWRLGEALEAGMVGINTGLISTELAPFGGVKQSGMGREGSKYGCDDYLEIKSLCFGEIRP